MKDKSKGSGGRPRIDPRTTKDAVLTIRLSREERSLIADAAARDGVAKDSDWARRVLLKSAMANS